MVGYSISYITLRKIWGRLLSEHVLQCLKLRYFFIVAVDKTFIPFILIQLVDALRVSNTGSRSRRAEMLQVRLGVLMLFAR